MLEPVAVTDRYDRYHWNRQKDTRDAGDLRTAQYSENDPQRVQADPVPDEPRVNHIVLDEAQYEKKYQDPKRLTEGVKAGNRSCNRSRQERPNDRNQFQ